MPGQPEYPQPTPVPWSPDALAREAYAATVEPERHAGSAIIALKTAFGGVVGMVTGGALKAAAEGFDALLDDGIATYSFVASISEFNHDMANGAMIAGGFCAAIGYLSARLHVSKQLALEDEAIERYLSQRDA